MNPIKYYDGSNNLYRIYPDKIDYYPMTPERSSSGTYSGGEPWEQEISEERYQQIWQMIQEVVQMKTVHLQNRTMGSGMLHIPEEEMTRRIIFSRGKFMRKFENALQVKN